MSASTRRISVLHLAFEDHRRPGSGGGAYRTHEVARRMAERHQVTVVTTTWRGARDRLEEGVRYVHVGLPGGYLVEVLSYFLCLPFVLRRYEADVVVEDFAAPMSSALVPLYERRRPVVALVQWLNAEEKSAQYHLPLHLVQRWGVRLHRRFIAVSEDIAGRLRRGNPVAEVTVVPNGVDRAAFDIEEPKGTDIVFLGRIEIAQKGIDLLVQAVHQVRDRLPGRVLLVGDGPDEGEVAAMIERAGLDGVVVLVGRLSGIDRLRLLSAARLTVMPSRFETFGIVAVESHAVGTPVLAFDIDCLREVVPEGTGRLVPAFDVAALAESLVELSADAERSVEAGRRGRDFARRFDWDLVAAQQESLLVSAAGQDPPPVPGDPPAPAVPTDLEKEMT
jgi:glycosyltransferase involved in cell wall biosynthesis